MSASVQRKLQQAHLKLQAGEVESAAALSAEVLQRAPRNPQALWLLGTARLMSHRLDEAVSLLTQATLAAPKNGAALEHLGLAQLMRGDYAAAEEVLRRAAAIVGAPASVRMRLGLALFHQDRHAEAVVELKHSLALEPRNPDAHTGLGRAYAAQLMWADAQREFEIVLAQAPADPDTLYNLGVVSFEQHDFERACSWLEKCIRQAPAHVEAHERFAAALLKLGRYRQAMVEIKHVVQVQPSNADALCALAETLFQCGDTNEALLVAAQARDIDPTRSAPYSVIAQIHHVRGELDRAVEALEAGLARTNADGLLGTLVHLLHRQCDWARWAPAWERMAGRLNESTQLGSPFWILFEATSAEEQLSYTRRWVAQQYPMCAAAALPHAARTRDRVRIGYYSGDFHQHPMTALMAEVFELHDRSRFEVYAYSYGPDDHSAMRARVTQSIEHFVDVAWDPDDIVEKRIRADELDILIDLKGYTAGDRLSVMAKRPCAIQIEWLGYPGPIGAPFIDYEIVDGIIAPPGEEHLFSTHVLRMPHCYQANDRRRVTAPTRSRREYDLPEDAFVFCCFNQSVKITPEVYACWMKLLQRIPNSVLWLPEDNRWATANLHAAAEASGVAKSRIVIAPRMPLPEHLARYRAADLALDTFPYTSHTTGSDALWHGCPLVALRGNTFAARVSASLLINCGIPELVTRTLDEYEALAFRLASDKAYMHEVKARLELARDSALLFDSKQFTRDLEQIYWGLVR
ncbi:MAG: tetratricopeptide repeat protein [Pseudomonadota bacterium]